MTNPAEDQPTRGRRGPPAADGPSLRDVARHAGVSVATVSRVFAGNDRVQPALRDRVLASAAELHYVINEPARAMTGRGRRTVAFVVHEMVGATFAAMAAGAESVVTEQGGVFVVCTTHGEPVREQNLIETLRQQRASAVMLVGTATPGLDASLVRYHAGLASIGSTLLLCGRPPVAELPEVISIDYDHIGGIASAVAHLARLGHRRIAFLGGQPGTTFRRRLDGYRLGIRTALLDEDPRLVIDSVNSAGAGQHAAGLALDLDPGVTALVCQSDSVAVGAYREARRRGIGVPDELSITGFDDLPLVGDLTPALTTVRAPFREIGELAGKAAIGALEFTRSVMLGTELVVRDSTAAPPSARQ